MAKKKNEEPVYSAAPLVIPKDKFVKLLQEQISKGKELLEITVPLKLQQNPFYGYTGRNNDCVEYEEAAEKEFIAKFDRWHDRNKEIYRSSFESSNSIYYHEYETLTAYYFIGVDIVKEYKDDISNLMNKMQTDVERIDLIRCIAPKVELVDEVINKQQNELNNKQQTNMQKKPMVFISHKHDDKLFVEELCDLLEDIGLTGENLFCSSIPELWIGLGKNIIEELKKLFHDHDMYVIFIQSPRYYSSPISLNEMGAAWVLQSKCRSILTPDMKYGDMKGVVNDKDTAIKVDDQDAEFRLVELRDEILGFLGLKPVDEKKWMRKSKKFLSSVSSVSPLSIQAAIEEPHKKSQASAYGKPIPMAPNMNTSVFFQNNNKEKILSFIANSNGQVNAILLANELRLSSNTVKSILKELADEGRIRAYGDMRNPYFHVIK